MPPSEEDHMERGGEREVLRCGYPTDIAFVTVNVDRDKSHRKNGPLLSCGENGPLPL